MTPLRRHKILAETAVAGLRTRKVGTRVCASLPRFIMVAFTGMSICLAGCGDDRSDDREEGLLVQLGDERLTEDDVAMMMPAGLAGDDSVRARLGIINDWLTDRLMEDVAREYLPDADRERIERLVADYRRDLTVDTYRRRLMATYDVKASPDSVREWYRTHRGEMTATAPLAMGLLIRIPSNSPRLDDARRWVAECSEESVDLIETTLLDGARGYECFTDRWVDLAELAEQVPGMPRGAESLASLPADYEVTSGGWTTILHLSRRLEPGELLPFDYAAPIIARKLEARSMRRQLFDLTFAQAGRNAREGKLKISPEAEEALPIRLIPKTDNKNENPHRQ